MHKKFPNLWLLCQLKIYNPCVIMYTTKGKHPRTKRKRERKMKAVRTVIVKDTRGNEVWASDITELSIEMFKPGKQYTLRNKKHTFWAEVECVSKRNNVYTFESILYGDRYKVDFNNNTVTRTEYSI